MNCSCSRCERARIDWLEVLGGVLLVVALSLAAFVKP